VLKCSSAEVLKSSAGVLTCGGAVLECCCADERT